VSGQDRDSILAIIYERQPAVKRCLCRVTRDGGTMGRLRWIAISVVKLASRVMARLLNAG